MPIIEFTVDDDDINVGDCTTLRAHIEQVQEARLSGAEYSNSPVTGPYWKGSTCPASTTTYTLHVVKPDGSTEDRTVKVKVTDTTPPPAPSPSVPADGLTLSCRSSQTLVWVPVSDPSGISGYYVKLEIQVTPGNWQSVGGWGPVTGKQVDVSVQCGGYYRWTVRAQDGAGNYSDWSKWSHFSVVLP